MGLVARRKRPGSGWELETVAEGLDEVVVTEEEVESRPVVGHQHPVQRDLEEVAKEVQ